MVETGEPERTPLTVCVVDDEPPARRALEVLLRNHRGVTVVGVCGDGRSAVDVIGRTNPDVVFLDVQMPGCDGFDVVGQLGRTPPVIVFVTAYDEYAVKAFEARALDYLVKPFSDERFETVLARVRDEVQGRRGSSSANSTSPARPLVVRDGHKTVILRPDEIAWLEAEDYYVRIHAGTQRPLVRRTLRSLIAALASHGMVRVHRSAAVNVAFVRELRPLPAGDAELQLTGGERVRVSRSYRAALEARLVSGSAS